MIHIIGILSLFCCAFAYPKYEDYRWKVLEVRTSGKCTDIHEGAYIGSQADCQEAATDLGWGDTSAYLYNSGPNPRGCYGYPEDTGGGLYFNTITSPMEDCSYSPMCICTFTALACSNKDGSAPNSLYPCICGNKACKSAETTGMHCYKSENRCSKFANLATCAITDGSAPNPSTCACGSVDCDDTTGLHCYESENKCRTFANAVTVYEARTSGYCTDVTGWAYIESKAECEEGVRALGWGDNVEWRASSYYPRGCYKAFYKEFNTDTSSTESCSSGEKCLCAATAPACAITDGTADNSVTESCWCGTNLCTESTGRHCYAQNNNKCLPFANAVKKLYERMDGYCTDSSLGLLASNRAECEEGARALEWEDTVATVVSVNGRFPGCFLEDGNLYFNDRLVSSRPQVGYRCSLNGRCICALEGPVCQHIDGNTVNTGPCVCGASGCDDTTGLYCDASKNHCDEMAGPYSYTYFRVTSGTCESNGYEYIDDVATCAAGAAQLGLSDTSADISYPYYDYYYPRGCYMSNYNSLETATGSRECGQIISRQGSKFCLCGLTVPNCPHTHGHTENQAPCLCGASGCEPSTGLFCDTSNNGHCSSVQSCVNTVGSAANSAVCACGAVDCDAGLFCTSSLNRCRSVPSCVNTDGSAANSADCACGSAQCTTDTGLFCDASKSSCSTMPGLHTTVDSLTAPDCPHDDGATANAGPCVCGTSACSSDNGLFCTYSLNRCGIVPCANTIGTAVNSESCTCDIGTSSNMECTTDTGLFCDTGTDVLCTDKSPSVHVLYQDNIGGNVWGGSITGLVPDAPYTVTWDVLRSDLGSAAEKVNWVKLNGKKFEGCPGGGWDYDCYFVDCAASTSTVRADSDGTVVMQTEYQGHSYDCDCKRDEPGGMCQKEQNPVPSGFTATKAALRFTFTCGHQPSCSSVPSCVNTDGAAANSADCACGTTDCDATTGLFCFADDNRCRFATCSNTDGSAANSADCACGTADCDATTGLFCFADDNLCRFATCSNTVGSAANSADCACGTADCDAGLFCTSSLNRCSSVPSCVNTDGAAANSADCACGTTVCDDDPGFATGLFCFADDNRCRFATCSNTDGSAANSANCACGTTDCDATTGLFCFADDNRCRFATCSNTDGYTANSANCACGTTDCDATTGLYCDTSNNGQCSSRPVVCATTDGSAPNPHACACGTVDCETAGTTGMFCMAGLNQCSKDGRFKLFEARTSGRCTDKSGGAYVDSQAECAEGARALGWPSQTSAYEKNYNGWPRGCYKLSSNNARFLNKATSSTASCSTSMTCMCTVTLPACTNTDGSNPADCLCRSAQCTSNGDGQGTGLVCTSASSTCSRPAACATTDGSAPNPSVCACGSVDCEGTTDMHCYASENRCRAGPVCAINDGSTDNSAPCACGSVDCDGTTGLHCYESINTCRTIPTCAIADGSVANSEPCACGSVDCAGGEYCHELHKKCTGYAPCIADGSAVNSADCACGSVDCKAGEYCYYGTEDWLTQWGLCRDSSDGQLC